MQKCGECTLCCKTCKIEEVNSSNGVYCRFCNLSVGCEIYDQRPEECEIFKCCYLQMNNVHPDLRPDRCGVVFEKINDTLILGSIDGKLDEISELIHGQIRSFVNEGISVMMQQFNPYKYTCYHLKGVNKNDIIKALRDKANDNPKLYRRSN